MKAAYSEAVDEALEAAPAAVRKAFFKQINFLVQNLQHPSLHAKKYDEANDRWQARSTRAGGSTSKSLTTRITSSNSFPTPRSNPHQEQVPTDPRFFEVRADLQSTPRSCPTV